MLFSVARLLMTSKPSLGEERRVDFSICLRDCCLECTGVVQFTFKYNESPCDLKFTGRGLCERQVAAWDLTLLLFGVYKPVDLPKSSYKKERKSFSFLQDDLG